ncbi:hypothetical protein ACFFQF_08530 [Haladaptatus pallidirubidus]|uniref:hypothetical protein n=1 Tax=Haladaptatus pallidirubidus TaxID=1008152 RepID=UPI001D12E3EB|nr:hypothetical protein [Haladaptatus pallidirubidus]
MIQTIGPTRKRGTTRLSETAFVVDGRRDLTILARSDLDGHLDHVERNTIEKRF